MNLSYQKKLSSLDVFVFIFFFFFIYNMNDQVQYTWSYYDEKQQCQEQDRKEIICRNGTNSEALDLCN